jgi:hypothetical protein
LLAGGALLAYLLYLTDDFFLGWSPLKGRVLFWVLLVFLAIGLGFRLYLTYPQQLRSFPVWLRKQATLNWPWLVLLLAFGLGGLLRWQAIQKPPALTEREQLLAASAVRIVQRSDWRPPNFSQPPLYLYTNALLIEGLSVLGASKPGAVPIDELKPETFLSAERALNLGFGLLNLLLLYASGVLLFGRRAGAVAAMLFATAWFSYRATPMLVPQTLAAFLAALAFYLLMKRWRQGSVPDSGDLLGGTEGQGLPAPTNSTVSSIGRSWFWAGAFCGLATSAAYGAIFLLIPLALIILWQPTKSTTSPNYSIVNRQSSIVNAFLGWLLAFTLMVSGWFLSLPNFLDGLAAIGGAPADATKFYLKDLAGHDPGLFLGLMVALGLGVVTFFVKGLRTNGENKALWLSLSFPLIYLLSLLVVGPKDGARLALVAPFLALCSTYPVEVVSKWVAVRLNDERHRWAGNACAFGLTLLLLILGVLARRILAS